jgi:phytoene synthase
MALAYAPASAREPTLALFALDARLASLIRQASEPMLAQLRLAWWREALSGDPARWPGGEALLAVLRCWRGRLEALVQLVDGWEAMSGDAPLASEELDRLASARGEAFGSLAEIVGASGHAQAAAIRGRAWALADIASRLTHPEEITAAMSLVAEQDWKTGGLPRGLRPLAVLHGLAARSVRRDEQLGQGGPLALVAAVRLGLLGR